MEVFGEERGLMVKTVKLKRIRIQRMREEKRRSYLVI
jgi:hypothetical protein